MPVRPIYVASGRTPFEVATLAALLVAGTLLVATENRPRSVTEGMPAPVQVAWEIGLVAGGLVGLVGVLPRWPDLSTGLLVELIGVATLGCVTAMYAIALFVVTGAAAIAAGASVTAVAVGSWWRVAQIVVDLRRAGRAVEAGHTAPFTLLAETVDE